MWLKNRILNEDLGYVQKLPQYLHVALMAVASTHIGKSAV